MTEPAFAYIELELEAVLKPQEGFFGLTARLSPGARALLRRFADLLSAAVFLALAVGSIWIASGVWAPPSAD